MKRMLFTSCAALLSGVVIGTPLHAQASPDLAAPYSRYTIPVECAQVAPRRERQFWHNQRPDTIAHLPMGDVGQASTVSAARACVARFDVHSVAQRDLIGFGEAQLSAEQPAQADVAFQRLLKLLAHASVSQRGWALSQIVQLYAGAPGQMSQALAYVKQLDALGDSAAPGRLAAYLAIIQRAQYADSLSLLESAVTGALRASHGLMGDSAKQYAISSAVAYLAQADVQGRRHHPEQAIATIQTARATLGPLRRSVLQLLAGAEIPYTYYGKPSPVVSASEWFNGDGAHTQRPAAGKPALLIFGYHNCGDKCYPGYAILRRLAAKYASMGLQITLMTRTLGYYQSSLVHPDSEATLIRNYYVDYLHLPPNTLAVWNTTFERSPKDGRMMVTSAPNERAFRPNLTVPLPVVLVDAKGIVQCITSLNPQNEALIEHQLQAMR